MKIKGLTLLILFLCSVVGILTAQTVTIQYEKGNVRSEYAARKLTESLAEKGYVIGQNSIRTDYVIQLTKDENSLTNEAFAIEPAGSLIKISGGDDRGLIYGALALAESIQNGTPLAKIKKVNEKPRL